MIQLPLSGPEFAAFVKRYDVGLKSLVGLFLASRTYMCYVDTSVYTGIGENVDGYLVYAATRGAADAIPLVGYYLREGRLLIRSFPLTKAQAITHLDKLNSLLPIQVTQEGDCVKFLSHFSDGKEAKFSTGLCEKIWDLYFLPDGTFVDEAAALAFRRGDDLLALLIGRSLIPDAARCVSGDDGGGCALAFKLDYVESELGFVDTGTVWAVLTEDSCGFNEVYEFISDEEFEEFWEEEEEWFEQE